jgi:hypothetical protein
MLMGGSMSLCVDGSFEFSFVCSYTETAVCVVPTFIVLKVM